MLGTANVVGGFVVTDRMLEMFKQRRPPKARMSRTTTDLLYLVTIVTFILALRFLSSPKRARQGNLLGAAGMALAIAVTLAAEGPRELRLDRIAMAIGAVIGVVGARSVKMTAMPQMVALFNGVGGGAVALIALAEFHNLTPLPGELPAEESITILLSALIGSISFSGSLIAFAKLQELLSGRPIVYPGQQYVNAAVLLTALVLGGLIVAGRRERPRRRRADRGRARLRRALRAADRRRRHAGRDLAAERLHGRRRLGRRLSPPQQRADRRRRARRRLGHAADADDGPGDEPLDRQTSSSGRSARCRRAPAGRARTDGRSVRATTAEDLAIMLAYARKVVFVPGYGLAVAQAQHDVRALAELLEHKGDRRPLRHPPGRGPDARPHERPPRRGRTSPTTS